MIKLIKPDHEIRFFIDIEVGDKKLLLKIAKKERIKVILVTEGSFSKKKVKNNFTCRNIYLLSRVNLQVHGASLHS